MCRIFGHLHRDVAEAALHAIAAMLRHGGPDGCGVACGDGWGIGATRLAIMDPEGGAQPYELGGIRVAFNGEIYNHEELRERLARRGYRFADRCDGSVIAPMYLEHGEDFASHLDGMFAIALLDLRGEPRLTLATDRVGIKPLYYYEVPGDGICFASEIPAVLAFPGTDSTVCEGALDAYLSTKAIFGERTCYRRIRALPPGALLSYSRQGGLSIRRLPCKFPTKQREPRDLDDAGVSVRRALRTEVARLARADVPVAAICSGGLDSSLVTAMLAKVSGDVTAFHIGYGAGWPKDELAFARLVASRCGAQLHEVRLDPDAIPELIPTVVRHLGQPNADPITVSTLALFRAVSAAGFKTVMSGDGADEFFGGYDRIREAVAADGEWASSYVDSLAAVPRRWRQRLYTAEYRDYADREPVVDELAEALCGRGSSRLDAMTRLEVGERLPAYHLRRVDHLSMACAVEVRVPFCQPAMARVALGLPQDLRVRGPQVKRALYRAAEGLLPAEVLRRPKQPFTLPIEAMLRPGSRLLDFARRVLSGGSLRSAGQLDPLAVKGLVASHERHPTAESALALWALMIFQVWLEGNS